jgi:hypothetical protein
MITVQLDQRKEQQHGDRNLPFKRRMAQRERYAS